MAELKSSETGSNDFLEDFNDRSENVFRDPSQVESLKPVGLKVKIEVNKNRKHAALIGHGYTPTQGFIFNKVVKTRESGKDELVWQTINPSEYAHEVNFTDKANENIIYLKLVNGDVKKMVRNDGVWSEAEKLTVNINWDESSEEHYFNQCTRVESKCRTYRPKNSYPVKRVVYQDPASGSEKTIWVTEDSKEYSHEVSVLSVTKINNEYPDKHVCILQENNNYLLFLRDRILNNWVDITKTRIKMSKLHFFHGLKRLAPEEYEVKYEFLRFHVRLKTPCNKVKYDRKKLIKKPITKAIINLSDSVIIFGNNGETLFKILFRHLENVAGDLPETAEKFDEYGLRTKVVFIK
ncbi:hypothetical protein TpMuguga_03g00835 [Theileria parva strain Muguga]|uniref:Uncharacterized protein n=1 Tax=Theileria parva TaxID=5875 RepID=Q4MYK6_THEPA|nr:uncharacterized protein TpMuguga_03g00835 [Theileria parva strain Muguga]EAN30676.1 hypothetical protein TpMuguga_03g00835 [Theileria parva strain Muguga]|eukprot:XP_762959.1 hypothetical protein [Theileria parva strain Muguga]